jgi:hypothetical protein
MKTLRSLIIFLLCFCALQPARADLVIISIPSSVSFNVTNVGVATAGSPTQFRISFLGLVLPLFQKFSIKVRANSANFTPPSGTGIPAANVSWTATGASGGSGVSGTLSSVTYNSVFVGNAVALLGYVDLAWSLAAPGAGIRAGNHTLTLVWKLESI